MNLHSWRAVAVVFAVAAAAALAILAVLALPKAAGIALALVVTLLALLLYRETERSAALRARADRAERLLATVTTSLEMAEAIDPVTRLANRFRLFERLQLEFRRSVRYHRPLSCILLDLDRFSAINEQFGEHFGDTVLAEFASLLAHSLRNSDLAARFEGEAFAVLLPETGTQQANNVAEQVRGRLKQQVFSNGVVACSLSASYGIAGVPDARISRMDDLIRLAAQALAEAKRRGRDRIVIDLPADPVQPPEDAPVLAHPAAPHRPAALPPAESA
jgi:diguanylate cyclase (GGDEF)-like protein